MDICTNRDRALLRCDTTAPSASLLQCCEGHRSNPGLLLVSDQDFMPRKEVGQRDLLDITIRPRMDGVVDEQSCRMTSPDRMVIQSLLNMSIRQSLLDLCEGREQLFEACMELALDLHMGMFLTQVTSDRDYADIHCQLTGDLHTLKVDEGSGCIIEFPLAATAKVCRAMKYDDKWYAMGAIWETNMPSGADHIIILDFGSRKLAFMFRPANRAKCFMTCIQLLISRAQQTPWSEPGSSPPANPTESCLQWI